MAPPNGLIRYEWVYDFNLYYPKPTSTEISLAMNIKKLFNDDQGLIWIATNVRA